MLGMIWGLQTANASPPLPGMCSVQFNIQGSAYQLEVRHAVLYTSCSHQ